jgi:hypothetical protein
MNSPGWAVELGGEKFDVDDFREMLAPPFDPWVEEYSMDGASMAILRSRSWVTLTEAPDVFRDAGRMIDRVNGALLLIHNDAKPVKLGQTIRFGSDGKREKILSPGTRHLRLTMGRVRATITRASASPSQPPEQSKLQKWLREAETDDTRDELFVHLNRANNWFDLYKSAELTRRLAGGAHKLGLVLGSDKKEWDRIWQTANCYRHAPDPKKPLPVKPAEFEGAREFILKVIPRIL